MRQPLGSYTTPLARYRSVEKTGYRLDADSRDLWNTHGVVLTKSCEAPCSLMVTSCSRNVLEYQLNNHKRTLVLLLAREYV